MKWFVILCLGLLFQQSQAEPLVMYTEHFPPYSYEQDQHVTGLNAEIVRRTCEVALLKCDFQLMPWLRALETAQRTPNSGLFSTARNALREKQFQWVGPIVHASANMYWLASRRDAPPQDLEEAKKYVVAVARGDVYEIYLQNQGFEVGVNLIQFNSKADAVLPFLHGKVDLLIASDLILPVWLEQHQQTLSAVTAIIDLSTIGNNYLALHPQMPIATVERLQAALDQLKANGEYGALEKQFLVIPSPSSR
ncbi:substrate-binding periplasmic protein [Rheinheimera sp. UJ63]|uniref:substrate-binding periplasmic protein n=1 Tax=Rheinheimera sp. UJ63 TaxID=2910157 RepID=UPI001F3825D7|nr:transporter substrate-binding domain-containing protein [Rheinheimera sp. UJ63]MCF4008795.1 transporter substrate-binding domain-containing protein [Rheinheimera sp. UJ63]